MIRFIFICLFFPDFASLFFSSSFTAFFWITEYVLTLSPDLILWWMFPRLQCTSLLFYGLIAGNTMPIWIKKSAAVCTVSLTHPLLVLDTHVTFVYTLLTPTMQLFFCNTIYTLQFKMKGVWSLSARAVEDRASLQIFSSSPMSLL